MKGEVEFSGDKSISHRALFFSAFASGVSKIKNLSTADDVKSTANCLAELGVGITFNGDVVEVEGKGLYLSPPSRILWAGNSGTTARILCTPLSAQKFPSALDGDESLRKRPFARIVEPLRQLGAKIWGKEGGDKLPLLFDGVGKLSGGKFDIIPSAQVKTALLLANWWSDDKVLVRESEKSRDHTERMMSAFGVEVKQDNLGYLWLEGVPKPSDIEVPGDISSASFFILAGVIVPSSSIRIKNVSLNPTRLGFVKALQKMGAKVFFEVKRDDFEPVGDIFVETSELSGISIPDDEIKIPFIIDEIPCLAVAGAFADGDVVVRQARELRVKESDRIKAIYENLKEIVEIHEFEDGFLIKGKGRDWLLRSAREKGVLKFCSFGDHRIAMAFYIMGLALEINFEIDDTSVISVSFPDFFEKLKSLM